VARFEKDGKKKLVNKGEIKLETPSKCNTCNGIGQRTPTSNDHITVKKTLKEENEELNNKELNISAVIQQLQEKDPSPYVANVLNCNKQQETIEMELCLGSELEALLQTKKSQENPSLDEILRLFGQLVLGVAWFHKDKHLIAHRDLKPENVVITRKGQVKIIDFGFCQKVDKNKPRKNNTFLGTPDFMAFINAPGGIAPDNPIKSDIFALGFVLLTMLADRKFATSEHLSLWKCPKCHGTGKIRSFVCYNCDGSGRDHPGLGKRVIDKNTKRLKTWKKKCKNILSQEELEEAEEIIQIDLTACSTQHREKIAALEKLMNVMVHPDEDSRPDLNNAFWRCDEIKLVQRHFKWFTKEGIKNKEPGQWTLKNCEIAAENILRKMRE